MSKVEKITIALPGEMLADVKAAVACGDYTNTSEVVRDALRAWKRSRAAVSLSNEELRQLVLEGRSSGEPVDGETALRRLRGKYAASATGLEDERRD